METIKIKEDVRVPGTDIILEAGDKIKVLKENRLHYAKSQGISEEIFEMFNMAMNAEDAGMTAAVGIEFAVEKMRQSDPEYAHNFLRTVNYYLKKV